MTAAHYMIVPVDDDDASAPVPIYGGDGSIISRATRATGAPHRATVISPDFETLDMVGDDSASSSFAPMIGSSASGSGLSLGAVYDFGERNATAAACARLISDAMVRRGWDLAPSIDPATGKPRENPDMADRALLERFYSRPHPFMSMAQILGTILPGYVLSGRFFVEVAMNALKNERTDYGRQPGFIFPDVPQEQIRARLKPSGEFASPAWSQETDWTGGGFGGKARYFDWEQIMWLQSPGMIRRGIFPMGPVEHLVLPLETNRDAQIYIRSYFTTGGKIGLVFEVPQGAPNAEKVAQAFRRYVQHNYTSAKKGHESMVLWGGMTVSKAPTSEGETDKWIAVLEYSRDEICAVFGVDPRLIAADRGGNMGGKGEREQAWHEVISNRVVPLSAVFAEAWTQHLHRRCFGIDDWDLVLLVERTQPSEEARATLVSVAKQAGEIGILDLSQLDELNALRYELYPDLPTLSAVPVRPAPDPKLAPSLDLDMDARAVKSSTPPPAAKSRFISRFDVRGAKSLLDDAQDELVDELRTGFGEMAEKVTTKIAELFVSRDIKGFKDLNLAPGGAKLITAGRRKFRRFYELSLERAAGEVAALAPSFRADGIADELPGNIAAYLDLVEGRFFDDLFGAFKARIALDTFEEGLAFGWSRKEFVSALTERFADFSARDIQTNVRTELTDFFNLARERTFRESGALVQSLQYTSVLDDRTTLICQKLDGITYRSMDDPNLTASRPPNHFQCRATIVPIMAGEDFEPTPARKVASAMALIQDGFGKRCRHG